MKILKLILILLLSTPNCYAYLNDAGPGDTWIEVDGTDRGRPRTIVTSPDVITFSGNIMSLDVATPSFVEGLYARLDLGNQPFQSAVDSTTSFQILDNDGGTPVFNADTTNERVGIGTNSPVTPLDLGASIVNANYLTIGPTSGTMALEESIGIQFRMRNTAGGAVSTANGIGASIQAVQDEAGTNTGALAFEVRPSETSSSSDVLTEAVRIDNDGNVGIGTTDPSADLHISVSDTGNTHELLRLTNLGGGADTGSGMEFHAGAADTELAKISADFDAAVLFRLRFNVNSSDRMVIDGNGKVGIGLTDPAQKLEIASTNGTDRISIYHDNTNANFLTDDGKFKFTTDEGTNTQTILNISGKGTGSGQLEVHRGDGAGQFFITCDGSTANIRANVQMDLQTNADNNVTMFKNAAEGETPSFQIHGRRTGDIERVLDIAISSTGNDAVEFTGLNSYNFDSNLYIVTGDLAVGNGEVNFTYGGDEYFNCEPSTDNLQFGDLSDAGNSTKLVIDDSESESIFTNNLRVNGGVHIVSAFPLVSLLVEEGTSDFLLIDPPNDIYKIGDIDTANNGYNITVDDRNSAILFNGNSYLSSDTTSLFFGASNDMKIYYDGLDGNIDTDLVAASDLVIDCGTDKTIELEETVWKDNNLAVTVFQQPAASIPDIDEFVDEGGTDTGIPTYAFAIGEKVAGNFEMQHDYKEGSDFTFHVHWQGIAAPSGTDNVQWRLTYTLSRDGETLDATTTIDSPDTEIDTQYDFLRSDFAAINGSTAGNNGGGVKIGDQFLFTIERVAATGDAYAGDALVATIGIHYQIDTIGSRQIGTK